MLTVGQDAISRRGAETLDWWPDWRDRSVAIVASGPSTKKANVAQLRGRLPVIAIKENSELCPWADIVYGCDRAWWRNVQGLPKFTGLKISATAQATMSCPNIKIITVRPSDHKILLDEPAVIGSGGNSGFQALNLAVQFGATRILLVGYDMDDRAGVHWYGKNRGQGRSNPGDTNFRLWRAAFGAAAPKLKIVGVEVVNASVYTTLTCFPKITIEQALLNWNL